MESKVIEKVSNTISNAINWFNVIQKLIDSFVAYNDFDKDRNIKNLERFMEILGQSEVYPINIQKDDNVVLDNPTTHVVYTHIGNLTFTIRIFKNFNIVIDPEVCIRGCGDKHYYHIINDTLIV